MGLFCSRTIQVRTIQVRGLKKRYEASFLFGDYGIAEAIINEVEQSFGQSIWLLSSKFQLIQKTKGLKAQKAYLEEVASSSGLNPLAAFLSYYFSVRNEDNVSATSLESELNGSMGDSPLQDFIIMHLMPYKLPEIVDVVVPISMEEAQPVVDRYNSFIAMCFLEVSNNGIRKNDFVHVCLRLLMDVGDELICRLIDLVEGTGGDGIRAEYLSAFDKYTAGVYGESYLTDLGLIEIEARRLAHLGVEKVGRDASLIEQASSSMSEVIGLSKTYKASLSDLKKISITCNSFSVSAQIESFIERSHDYEWKAKDTKYERLLALHSNGMNPLNSHLMQLMLPESSVFELSSGNSANSVTIALRRYTETGGVDSVRDLSNLEIPGYRKRQIQI